MDFDITRFLLNSNTENRKYKLKSVVSCYQNDKYFADVLINGFYYRIMDTQSYPDVKQININQLMQYEPTLLIYEIDYNEKMLTKMKQLFTMALLNNLNQMMLQNMNLFNLGQGFPNQNNANNFLNLKFLVIPQNWDGSQNNSFPISPQVRLDFTLKYAIDKFYSKLVKPKEAIMKFLLNNNLELDVNSQQKLKDLNINENSIIYAIKSPQFDELKFG